MRRFLTKLFCFAVLQALIAAFVISTGRSDKNSFLAASVDKHRRLESQKPPRMIFVGGSSTAFGVDSTIVRESLPYEPVNMGLHANLGLEVMLSEIEPYIGKGDVVVLMVENIHLMQDTFSSAIWFDLMLHRPACIRELKCMQVINLLDTGLASLGRLTRACRMHLRGRRYTPVRPYTRDSFNKYGDAVAHHSMPRPADFNIRMWKYDKAFLQRSIRRLNRFDEFARKRGAVVVFYYPPLHAERFQNGRAETMSLHHELLKRLTIPVLIPPEEAVQPDEEFFDTAAHLTYAGKVKRTKRFVEAFREWARQNSPDALNEPTDKTPPH